MLEQLGLDFSFKQYLYLEKLHQICKYYRKMQNWNFIYRKCVEKLGNTVDNLSYAMTNIRN